MGFNTTINIINDGFDQIEKYPEDFVKGIRYHMLDGGEFGVGNHANVVTVAKSGHADAFRLYGINGNSMIELSRYSRDTEELIERFAHVVRAFVEEAKRELRLLEEYLDERQDTA